MELIRWNPRLSHPSRRSTPGKIHNVWRLGLSLAAIIQPVMTSVGVFTFLAGVLYLPALAPSRVEMIGLLLLLAAVALLCHAVGLLTAILERLDGGVTNPPNR
ncbi:MAG TPA: hypothetical protein VE988_30160 [Gemmataceae bacterium]|nr:hypothetical protein [Gemmataceae bacterium]